MTSDFYINLTVTALEVCNKSKKYYKPVSVSLQTLGIINLKLKLSILRKFSSHSPSHIFLNILLSKLRCCFFISLKFLNDHFSQPFG